MTYRPFSCHDGFCGASDCPRCFPNQQDEEETPNENTEQEHLPELPTAP